MGLGEIGLRPLSRVVRVRMIEADDVFTALAAFTLDANQFARINVVTVVGGVCAGVTTARRGDDDARAIVFKTAEQYAAAFVRISLFAVAAKGVVAGAGEYQHSKISPPRRPRDTENIIEKGHHRDLMPLGVQPKIGMLAVRILHASAYLW
jgi:hypothetical protein